MKQDKRMYAPDASSSSASSSSAASGSGRGVGDAATADGAAIALPSAKQAPAPGEGRGVARRAKPAGHNRVDAHIGARMRTRRKFVGLSQDALAERLDLTVQQIQKHERGRNRVDPTRLFEIAQALGVDVAYFYEDMAMATLEDGGHEAAPTSPAAAPRPEVVDLVHTILFGILARPETVDLIRSYGRIADPRLRRKVFDIIDDREAEPDETQPG